MQSWIPGPRNLLTDVEGILIGNCSDSKIKSGVTAVVCEEPTTASVHVMGGAPGTRETDLLSPENTVEQIDAIILSGGSAFGLDAASGAQAALCEKGRGFVIGPHAIPIVPAAILFDLINGGDKNWGRYPPYRELGFDAVNNAAQTFLLGSVGAGTGALTATCKGGLGSASSVITFEDLTTITVGALVAVNPIGSPLVADTAHFWAAPFEQKSEFGGLGICSPLPQHADTLQIKQRELLEIGANTTIGIIATDANLSKAQNKRLAMAAHDGIARAIWPSHTPLDGDLIFSLATGKSGVQPTLTQQIELSAMAASTMSRAIARGVYAAEPVENDLIPAWQSRFGP